MPLPNGELTMADDIFAANLAGVAADAYGCYDNGNWPDAQQVQAEHPGSRIVDFTVYLANVGTGGDVEKGDMTPAQGAAWIVERQAAGVWSPIGYASIGDSVNGMPALVAAARSRGIADGSWRRLSAHYGWQGQLPGLQRGQHICGPSTCGSPIQCQGTQWWSGPNYDLSLLAADFFGPAPVGPIASGADRVRGLSVTPDGRGYWIASNDGTVRPLGDAGSFGDLSGKGLAQPVVRVRRTPDGRGYWMVAADGGVFPFGDAGFHGSAGGAPLARPVVDLVPTPSGGGYWLIASDGGVFAYGDAGFHGSLGGTALAAPIVGAVGSPTGGGYLLAGADGGVFTFGDAGYHGSLGGIKLAEPIVAIAGRPQGDGYWLVGSDGGVFSFGAAAFHGSTGGVHLAAPVVDAASSPDGGGYLLTATDGGVFTFGDAHFEGSAA